MDNPRLTRNASLNEQVALSKPIVPLRDEFLTTPPGPCGKVLPQALSTRLADVVLSTDRGNPICRKLFGEHLCGLSCSGSISRPLQDTSSVVT